MPALTRRAHAKINFALSVGPPEPPGSAKPGWHPISSWMHAIDLADDVRIERAAGKSDYAVTWAGDAPRPTPIDWPIDADLAVRAHRLLEAHAGRPLSVHLSLEKRIPVGGGLGGGSSDAAATLFAINTLFALGLSPTDLRALSQRLGSDVAFFIDEQTPAPPRPAIVSGFGDRIERLTARRTDPLVLLVPDFGCPTPAVYRAYDDAPRPLQDTRVRAAAAAQDSVDFLNDLTAPASVIAPRLPVLLGALWQALGRDVHMTGSGSTLFVLAASPEDARSLAARAASVPGITPVPTRLV